jgi:hypothetical protein
MDKLDKFIDDAIKKHTPRFIKESEEKNSNLPSIRDREVKELEESKKKV